MKWLEKANEIAFEMFFLLAAVGLMVALVGVLWVAARDTWGF